MGQALYRKYRSKSLSEVIGQEHVTKTLASALEKGLVSHAYLFTGPRGVGKTSIARILAYAVNNLPYDEKSTHLDIIEIDAASNRRIDEIRELRERISNAPASARYKVYIIDEVHMLTKEAFNALLKTLEEPPEHVIFILATTEAHKLPETIISRTQRFTFKPIDKDKAVKHLAKIAKKEGIEATKEALELMAKHGEGSFRDSISLLDQAAAQGTKIDAEAVRRMLGEVPETALTDLISSISAGDSSRVIELLRQLKEQGLQAEVLAKQLAEQTRRHIMAQEHLPGLEDTTSLLGRLIEVPMSHDPWALLEIILLQHAFSSSKPNRPGTLESIRENVVNEHDNTKTKSADINIKSVKSKPALISALDEESWQVILDAIKSRHNTLYSLIRMAVPSFGESELFLECTFPFHQKRLNDDRNKHIVVEIIKEITGQNVKIVCTLGDKKAIQPKSEAEQKVVNNSSTLDSISNIFGDAEIVD